jgi:membrane-bound serine protease (ClpP class)
MRGRTETGQEGLVGEIGKAATEISRDSGKVFVHGEWWNAFADEIIPVGTRVKVESMKNFKLKVSVAKDA